MENEGKKYVWEGAIPLQIHLHDSEVTTLPPPSPALSYCLNGLTSCYCLRIMFLYWYGDHLAVSINSGDRHCPTEVFCLLCRKSDAL
ncbi:hypothetical protein Tco_1425729 [Tanacetum coccineum]